MTANSARARECAGEGWKIILESNDDLKNASASACVGEGWKIVRRHVMMIHSVRIKDDKCNFYKSSVLMRVYIKYIIT